MLNRSSDTTQRSKKMEASVVKEIIRGHRQYRLSDYHHGEGISKIWNHGMGRIGFICETDCGNVVVNAPFWRKTDARIAVDFIDAVIRENESHGLNNPIPTIICVDYTYPLYYNHCFGKHNPPSRYDLQARVFADIAEERERRRKHKAA